MGVAAGHVDLPMAGFLQGRDRDAHGSRSRQRLDQRRLPGEFLRAVRQHVGDGCRSDTVDGGGLGQQSLRRESSGIGRIDRSVSIDLEMIEHVIDQEMAFVERLALPHRERAEGEGELVGIAGVGGGGEVRGHLQHFALLVALVDHPPTHAAAGRR